MKTIINLAYQNLLINVTSINLTPGTIACILATIFIIFQVAKAQERYRRYKSFQNLVGGLMGRMAGNSGGEGATSKNSSSGLSFLQFIAALVIITLMATKGCEPPEQQGYNGIQANDQIILTDMRSATEPQYKSQPPSVPEPKRPNRTETDYVPEMYSVDSWGPAKEHHNENSNREYGVEVPAGSEEIVQLGPYTLQIVAASRYEAVRRKGLELAQQFDMPVFLYRGPSLTHLLIGAFTNEKVRNQFRVEIERKFGKKYTPKNLLELKPVYLERLH